MALISRISRLFKADFHAVLDQVEEPQLLLKQAVREMEEELYAAENRQRQLCSLKDELVVRHRDVQQALVDIEEELDVCFEEQEQELAKEWVKRKLQNQRSLKELNGRMEATEKALALGERTLQENRTVLESARQKAALFESSPSNLSGVDCMQEAVSCRHIDFMVSSHDIEVAFLREQKRRAQS